MRHFSCDVCGKDLTPESEARYVVRVEVFPAAPTGQLTEADLDQDHAAAMAELLEEMEEAGEDAAPVAAPVCRKVEYDLCSCCHRRFAADPLGRERGRKPRFSKN